MFATLEGSGLARAVRYTGGDLCDHSGRQLRTEEAERNNSLGKGFRDLI